MIDLTSAQRKYLRSQAHHLDPVIMVGKNGVTDELIRATDQALDSHELIKIRFQEFKDQKKELANEIESRTRSAIAGIIGHIVILYREQDDPEKRKYHLPEA